MKYLAGAVAALVLFADCAVARDRVELAPYSNWVMNYDDDSCALQRQFGEVGRQAYLELRSFGDAQHVQVVVASKDFDRHSGPFRFAVEPLDQEALEVAGFDMSGGDGYQGKLFSYSFGWDARVKAALRDFTSRMPGITEEQRGLVLQAIDLDWESRAFARLASEEHFLAAWRLAYNAFEQSDAWQSLRRTIESEVAGVVIERAFDETLSLRTGNLHAPMEAMRTCVDELQTHWGIDVEAHKTLSRSAEPLDYARLVRELQEDYPSRMREEGMQGYLRIRLNVSADGIPTACHLQSQINDEAFEEVACTNLMRFAKFAPALDKNGQPIASVFRNSIVYTLGR